MHKNIFILVTAVAMIMFVLTATAQEPAMAPFVTHQLRLNVYYIEGGGGHSGVIVGDTGVILIDAKTTPAGGKELLEDIARITSKPVNTVILTHSDPDHVNGLASFPTGLTIIAQENNKKEQEAAVAKGVYFARREMWRALLSVRLRPLNVGTITARPPLFTASFRNRYPDWMSK